MSDLKRLVDYGTDTEEEISSDSDDSSLKEDSSSIKPEK